MSERRAPEWLTRWEYAHRGLHSDGVPENSLLAARLAIEAGMGIECDIQRSRDIVPMVFHDWELDRLTDGGGDTGELSADELQLLRYRDGEERPASLRHLLDLIAGRVPVLIEIKSKPGYDVERSCEAVSVVLKSYSGMCAVMSFDPRVAAWFREHSAQTSCGLVMREDGYGHTQTLQERQTALQEARPDFLAYHIAALPCSWVADLRAGGLPVLTWTVNSPEARQRAREYADALISEGKGLA